MKAKLIVFGFILSLLISCGHHDTGNQESEREVHWFPLKTILNASFNECVKQYIKIFDKKLKGSIICIRLKLDTERFSVYEIDYHSEKYYQRHGFPSGYYMLDGYVILIYSAFETYKISTDGLEKENYNESGNFILGTKVCYILFDKKSARAKFCLDFPFSRPEEVWEWPIEGDCF